MRTIYFECNMGAAGDMLVASLLELLPDSKPFLDKMNSLGLPGVTVSAEPSEKCGIIGTHFTVNVGGIEEESIDFHGHQHNQSSHRHDHNRVHNLTTLESVTDTINTLDIPCAVKQNALGVYAYLAEAESKAHGKPVTEVHFHEVGSYDAIVDIVGFCLLINMLAPDNIVASPVHVGSGKVKTSHGILPVPAPATAEILLGVPTYSDGTRGELCTPTGAAILKYFVKNFTGMPSMVTEKIGYGMGKKDFDSANCVRAFLGEDQSKYGTNETLEELRCNVDDMTPEAVGYATETLLANGALDVYVEPVLMKKNRPGFVIVCICMPSNADRLAALILKHTTTIGVRRINCIRYALGRNVKQVETKYGKIGLKMSEGYGSIRAKPEYDDVADAAKKFDVSFTEVYNAALRSIK